MAEGVGIRIDGTEAAGAVAAALAARADDPRGLFDRIGASLVVSTQQRFEAGREPDGSPWPPSVRALAESGQTLVQTGRLVQSLTHIPSEGQVEVGTNVLYAAIHQFGGTITAQPGKRLAFQVGGQKVFAKKVTIPARPFLGIDQDDEAEIAAIAEDWLLPSPSSPPLRGEASPRSSG